MPQSGDSEHSCGLCLVSIVYACVHCTCVCLCVICPWMEHGVFFRFRHLACAPARVAVARPCARAPRAPQQHLAASPSRRRRPSRRRAGVAPAPPRPGRGPGRPRTRAPRAPFYLRWLSFTSIIYCHLVSPARLAGTPPPWSYFSRICGGGMNPPATLRHLRLTHRLHRALHLHSHPVLLLHYSTRGRSRGRSWTILPTHAYTVS